MDQNAYIFMVLRHASLASSNIFGLFAHGYSVAKYNLFLGKQTICEDFVIVKLRNNAISYCDTLATVTSPQGTKDHVRASFINFVNHSAIFGSTYLLMSPATVDYVTTLSTASDPPRS
jgi:hypothetical protein